MGSYDNSYRCPHKGCNASFSDPGGWQLPRLIGEHMEKMHPPQPGPVEKVKKWMTCTGCPALYTKWEDPDGGDRFAMTASCLLAEGTEQFLRVISWNWEKDDPTPNWCPAK